MNNYTNNLESNTTSRKTIKKDINRGMRTLFFYQLVMFFPTLFYAVYTTLTMSNSDKVDVVVDKLLNNGWLYISGIFVALGLVLLYRKKKLFQYDLRISNKKMTAFSFITVLCCFMSIQGIFAVVGTLFENILNYFGYTNMEAMAEASANANTFSMMLYAGFIGPIAEEILFRGALLRAFEKYGKIYAILISSLLFGIFHGNLSQVIFGFFAGIVLSYVTMEYSIKWAILLHILNNFFFGEVLSTIFESMPIMFANISFYVIYISFLLVTVITIWKNRAAIGRYVSENKPKKSMYLYTFTAFWFIIFSAINIFMALDGINKLAK